ncbi:MAG: ATP-binding protein [Acidobacteria bacterium]|nr:ATP-binding protein [Acidobacteriota bacterium]
MDFSLKIELASHPQLMSVVRSVVEKFSEAAGFAEQERRSIILAVDETLTNVIRHAYGNSHDQQIAVTCRKTDNGVEFLIEDRGNPLDTTKIRGRSLEDVKPGGLGTHLIASCMDEVKYERVGDGNRTRLFRKFKKH